MSAALSSAPKFLSLTMGTLALVGPMVVAMPLASAATIATPSYQIKIQVADSAIDAAGNPTSEFVDFAKIGEQTGTEQAIYLDTANKIYSSQGWSIRLRHKSDSPDFDLTYKWRHQLTDNSLDSEVIDEGLRIAQEQGFDSSDDNYESQVNASFNTSTLDFSNKKVTPCAEYGCVIGDKATAVKLAQQLEPGKMQTSTETTLANQDLLVSATVSQKTWDVEIDGVRTELEISTINDEHWVEISEKEISRKDAVRKREKLIEALKEAGYLSPDDAFKTGAALRSLH